MKARTPSFMARSYFPFAAAIGLLIAASHAIAEDNSSAATATPQAAQVAPETSDKDLQAASQTGQAPATTHTTYQNPFAEESKAPPIEGAVQSSTAGQWRRPTIPHWVAPPAESAADKASPLPPAKLLTSPEKSLSSPVAPQSHNEIPTLISQTAKPIQQSPSATKPKSSSASVVLNQPDSVGNGPAFPADNSSASLMPSPARATQRNSAPPTRSAPNRTDTPETCLGQAQAAAAQVNSVDGLTNVIGLCDRGLGLKPSTQLQFQLQRLSAWAHNRRGEVLAESQRLDDALHDFQAAIELDPKCSLAFHNRGVTFAQRNQYAAALRDFNRVIELNPGLAVAYRNRAELLSALGRTQDALVDYDRAIKSLPNDAPLYLARASAKQRLGDFAGAAADIERALKLTPTDAAALVQRGNLAADQGRFAEAERDFRRAIQLNAKLAEAHRSLAWLQATCPDAKFRKPDQALTAAKRAAELSPDDYQVLDTLAAAEASCGNFVRAAELQQKALTLVPLNLNSPLQERLAQYQQNRAYRTLGPSQNVRAASMESPGAPKLTRPATSPAKRNGIVR